MGNDLGDAASWHVTDEKNRRRESAGGAFKHKFRYLDLVVVELEPLAPLVFEPLVCPGATALEAVASRLFEAGRVMASTR